MGNYVKKFEAFTVNESNETVINEAKMAKFKTKSGEEIEVSQEFMDMVAKELEALNENLLNEEVITSAMMAYWAITGMITAGVAGAAILKADASFQKEQDEAKKKALAAKVAKELKAKMK